MEQNEINLSVRLCSAVFSSFSFTHLGFQHILSGLPVLLDVICICQWRQMHMESAKNTNRWRDGLIDKWINGGKVMPENTFFFIFSIFLVIEKTFFILFPIWITALSVPIDFMEMLDTGKKNYLKIHREKAGWLAGWKIKRNQTSTFDGSSLPHICFRSWRKVYGGYCLN